MTNPYYWSKHWRELRLACLERDRYRCIVEGCKDLARVVDHIETRPSVPYACEFDRLDNLRSLCASHDAQVKEARRNVAASRKQSGAFKVKGCDSRGQSLDPAHPWKR